MCVTALGLRMAWGQVSRARGWQRIIGLENVFFFYQSLLHMTCASTLAVCDRLSQHAIHGNKM